MPFAFQVIADTVHSQSVPGDIWFLSCQQRRCGCRCGTNKVIFLHHSAGKNPGFNLFSFSVSNSEADGWIFVFIAHGNAPFVLAVAAGVTDTLIATGIYSL